MPSDAPCVSPRRPHPGCGGPHAAEPKDGLVYGAAGKIGSTVARAFAREGAKVHVTGRTLEKVQRVAEEIRAAGGSAEAAVVDALDKAAVERHLEDVIARDGAIDVTFNAVWIHGELQGTSLVEMSLEDFTKPVMTGISTHFLTATAAARHMVKRGSGVILTLSASSAGLSGREMAYHSTGGFGVACSAIESLSRTLAGQLGRKGIRVVCLRSDAILKTWEDDFAGQADSPRTFMEQGTVLGRLPKLSEVAEAAVFAASDRSSAMSGTILNLTCGSILDKD